MDHKIPVVDPQEGFTTWDSYINRMFCPEENFQVLCSPCHDTKTKSEDHIRHRKNKSVKKVDS
jgi:5-methylcytosine-specific restriction endonuclease McrA